MKLLLTIISTLLTLFLVFDFFDLISFGDVATNWISLACLIIFLLCMKISLPTLALKCKTNFEMMASKKARHWTDVFAMNTKEWSSIFFLLSPFTVISVGISHAISTLIPHTDFLNMISMMFPVFLSMFIVFMFLAVFHNSLFLNNNTQSL